MARRIIIGEIVNLIKGLGGNPNKFMGTKSNISFLGKGPKESLFQGQIDIDGLMRSGFPLDRVISEAETAGGYATANKLNDLQLQRLKDNLIQLKEAYKPPVVANITDLGTGTGDLSPGGLEYLRRTGVRGAKQPYEKTIADDLVDSDLPPPGSRGGPDDIAAPFLPASDLMTRIRTRMDKIKQMSDDLGKVSKGEPRRELTGESGIRGDIFNDFGGVRTTFNPKNEVHVQKAEALLKDPQIKGLYTEAEVKNAYDFEGLYQSHFDKGHVDVAELLQRAGHNIPQMRSAARSALLDLMKKEGPTGSGLKDFVSDVDFKYISEGGGGRAGDPINLMVKYFGKNAAENLPKNATKENIEKFTEFVMKARDSKGRGINDPFFDREAIDFSELTGFVDDLPPFASGGRVDEGGLGEILQVPRTDFKYGSRAVGKGVLAILNRNKKNAEYMFKASDNVSPGYAKGDMKYNAELLAEQLAEDAGVVYDDLDHVARSEFYGTAYDYLAKEMGMMLQLKKIGKNWAEQQALTNWNPGKGRKPNASGGLAKNLEV